jgi:internalin A
MDNESSQTRTNVFVSYSRDDGKFLDEFHSHLAFHIRTGLITSWDDTKIAPGSEWRKELTNALNATKVAVLLVSANFLASDFIAENELPPLLKAAEQKEVTIFSVVLGSCVFNDTPISKYQTINNPAMPLNQMSRGKRDMVWSKLAKEIRDKLQENT